MKDYKKVYVDLKSKLERIITIDGMGRPEKAKKLLALLESDNIDDIKACLRVMTSWKY